MAKQQPVRHYIDDTGAAGRFVPNVREGQGSQINSEHSGFRARKNAMHAMDGNDDKNIEDRKDGDEPESISRPSNEEKEVHEGVKEVSGEAGRHYKD